MPFINYGFMEEIFNRTQGFHENKYELLEDFTKNLSFRNTLIGTCFIFLYYVITILFSIFSARYYDKIHLS
jgi:hypothetical protein